MSDASQAPETDTPEFGPRSNVALFRLADGTFPPLAGADDGTVPAPAETPVPEAPETPEPPSDPYESRYNDLRSEFDRRNNLIAAAQQGDAEALSELGFELYQEEQQAEPAPGEFDPFDPDSLQALIDARVRDQVEQAMTPFQEQQKQEQIELASASALHSLDGFDSLPQEAQDTIWDLAARVLPPRQDGLYDVEGAWQQFDALNNALQQSWASSKPRGARVAGGQAATDVPPNEDASLAELTKWAKEQMQIRGE